MEFKNVPPRAPAHVCQQLIAYLTPDTETATHFRYKNGEEVRIQNI